nr:MAG TPA: hypothetical protein [Caudoviricetes sp.]
MYFIRLCSFLLVSISSPNRTRELVRTFLGGLL